MPLIDGRIEPMVYPSAKHLRVLCSPGRRASDGSVIEPGEAYSGRVLPWRYRVLYGGRNGYKDWTTEALAVEMAVRVRKRFLYTREVQNSLEDSNKQLTEDTIERLGYSEYFTVQRDLIYCNTTNSTFRFRGLNDRVSKDVKSKEGVDICVLCEAEDLTEASFTDLDPTIRKGESELWIKFNTPAGSAFIYQYFIKNPPEDCISAKVTYLDAPDYMLTDVIRNQAEHMKATNYQKYLHVYMGEPRTSGLHFGTFGPHCSCVPFVIPEQDDNSMIFGSLDHGIAHCTSFGLYYLAPGGTIYRIFTYCRNGGTTESHAEAIVEIIEACRFSRYLYPREIYYDYAMDEQHRLNEHIYVSDLAIYKKVFSRSPAGEQVAFIPANKRKVDGCHALAQVFDNSTGRSILQIFDGLNDKLVEAIKLMETDKTNEEVYAKMDGDDPVDELRYGIMGVLSRAEHIRQQAVKSKKLEAARSVSAADFEIKQYGGLG